MFCLNKMRLTQKKIEEIVLSILGEEGLFLIKELYNKENVSEFDLAKRANKDIKVVRKMLYFLYNHNLVGFIRKKDKEKGWYIYYWTLLPDSIRFIYIKKKKELLERLKEKQEEEDKELFFTCPNDCVRLNFDDSMDLDFHCPECGELLGQDNSNDKVIFLKKKISEIEEELEQFKIAKKIKKAKTKERKKVVRKKAKVVKKKVAKKKAVQKPVQKTVKKPTKKTVPKNKTVVKRSPKVKVKKPVKPKKPSKNVKKKLVKNKTEQKKQ